MIVSLLPRSWPHDPRFVEDVGFTTGIKDLSFLPRFLGDHAPYNTDQESRLKIGILAFLADLETNRLGHRNLFHCRMGIGPLAMRLAHEGTRKIFHCAIIERCMD